LTKVLQVLCVQARSQKPPLPITVQSFSVKATLVSKHLLQEYETNLTSFEMDEASALKKMVFGQLIGQNQTTS